MYAKDRRADQMLANAREIGPEEAARIYSEDNFKKHGVVAAFRTTPAKFEAYMQRRLRADHEAKHGRMVGTRQQKPSGSRRSR